ncbi:MAG: hypothetical protein E6G51_06035 [Actinobacteria bacterium]|nr:MAG: hypothetical protein E6G51_06035 [Actinomycetota bacterium]
MQPVKEPPKKKQRQKVFLKSGEELTPELEDELAAEAERGYDLSKATWRIRTRPLLPDSPTFPEVSFRLSEGEFNAARQRAEDEGCTIGELAREAFDRYMDTDS